MSNLKAITESLAALESVIETNKARHRDEGRVIGTVEAFKWFAEYLEKTRFPSKYDLDKELKKRGLKK